MFIVCKKCWDSDSFFNSPIIPYSDVTITNRFPSQPNDCMAKNTKIKQAPF